MADQSHYTYVLSRGLLNLQHYLWKDALGYLLHPSIPTTNPGNLKIADLGTGTGIWLLDLARQLPSSAHLDGFDISAAQYPAPEHVPSNISLRILDSVNNEPAENLRGQYDIVHLRLFIGVIGDRDPSPLLLNALKMLRPGGYVQWDEFDPLRTIAAATHGKSTSCSVKVTELMSRVASTGWVGRLPDIFIENKLERIKYEFCREQMWQRKLASDTVCALAEEIASTVFDQESSEAKDLHASVRGAFAEICEGAYISQPFNVAVGQKPVGDVRDLTPLGLQEADL